MGMGMNTAGGFMGAASAANANQMQMNQAAKNAGAQETWTCSCGSVNTGKFCPDCGSKKPEGPWTCGCGAVNTGKFCSECGKPRP